MFLTRELHTQPGTFALLPQVRAAVTIPVLAAGGIADQSGVAGAVALGAAGVQVGTAYLLCPETNTSPLHRRALQAEPVPDTVLTNRFTGRPARAIVNRLLRELGATADHMPDFPLPPAALAPLRAVAEQRGLDDFSSLWCGQNASGCRPVPAAEITRLLAGGL
jgi:nitronate monooxygenase